MENTTQEVDSDEIAELAYKELEAEQKGQNISDFKKPDKSDAEPAKKRPEDEMAEPSETPKEETTEEPKTEEEHESSKEEGEPVQEQGTKEEEVKKEEKAEDDVIQSHALKNGQTYAEAKEDLDKTKAVLEKYKNDPLEIARALRSQQSAYDKLKDEKSKAVPTPQIVPIENMKADAVIYAEQNKDKVLAKYKNEFPRRTELMTDEAILEWAVDDVVNRYKTWVNEEQGKIKKTAEERREQLIASIPKEDIRFLNDVKLVLNKTDDSHILSPDYNIKDMVFWAKGQRYDDDIKAADARGFKRGQEGAKIMGAKTGGDGATAPKKPGQTFPLNNDQKKRAIEMFEDDGMTADQAYKAYQDTFKEELKASPNFLG